MSREDQDSLPYTSVLHSPHCSPYSDSLTKLQVPKGKDKSSLCFRISSPSLVLNTHNSLPCAGYFYRHLMFFNEQN